MQMVWLSMTHEYVHLQVAAASSLTAIFIALWLVLHAVSSVCRSPGVASGSLAQSSPRRSDLRMVFFVLQLGSIVVSWIYFLPPPVILSSLVAICTGWAAWLVSASKP